VAVSKGKVTLSGSISSGVGHLDAVLDASTVPGVVEIVAQLLAEADALTCGAG
jgi:osmotically-inducible protein OsmY